MKDTLDYLQVNAEEKYLYTRKLSEYTELNQDLFLWVIETSRIEESYYNTDGDNIYYATKFVVEGKKIDRAKLPQLNLILQSFTIGYWPSTSYSDSNNYTHINFNFPTATSNRKFTLKIGRVTDNSILTKIKNNDYTGITDLLLYAKNNKAVYSERLTTSSEAYFKSDTTLFDGRKLLENKAYYFIYVEFDDENGKYIPVEGVTLGQAWFSSTSDSWDLWAYTKSDFQWDNLTSTYTPTSDPTTAPGILPQTGTNALIVIFLILATTVTGVILYRKYSNY